MQSRKINAGKKVEVSPEPIAEPMTTEDVERLINFNDYPGFSRLETMILHTKKYPGLDLYFEDEWENYYREHSIFDNRVYHILDFWYKHRDFSTINTFITLIDIAKEYAQGKGYECQMSYILHELCINDAVELLKLVEKYYDYGINSWETFYMHETQHYYIIEAIDTSSWRVVEFLSPKNTDFGVRFGNNCDWIDSSGSVDNTCIVNRADAKKILEIMDRTDTLTADKHMVEGCAEFLLEKYIEDRRYPNTIENFDDLIEANYYKSKFTKRILPHISKKTEEIKYKPGSLINKAAEYRFIIQSQNIDITTKNAKSTDLLNTILRESKILAECLRIFSEEDLINLYDF